jgi:hypothetical protein
LGVRFICKEVSDESGAKQDTASCCQEDYSRFWTFGSSSISTGAGLSSIMMSVTSLPDYEGHCPHRGTVLVQSTDLSYARMNSPLREVVRVTTDNQAG